MTQEEACAVLGITDEDDEKAIDNKYKKLMREYHPDANEGRPEAAQMASRINEAHDRILEDIREGNFALPGDRKEEPTLASLRRKEQEKPKKEVYFTKEDMVSLAEDMQGEMAEKPSDFDALKKHAGVLRKMVAEQHAQDAETMKKKDIQAFELQVEELRMAMYKLMDGKSPKYRAVLDDARDFLDSEAYSEELADSLASVDTVCDEVRSAIRQGRDGLAAYQQRKRGRTRTAILCLVIIAAGILVTLLLVTKL